MATLCCILSYVVHVAVIRWSIYLITSTAYVTFTIMLLVFFLSLKNPGDRRRTRIVRRARHETLEEEADTEV